MVFETNIRYTKTKQTVLESGFKKINSSPSKPVITHHVAHGPKRANIRILNKELKKDVHEHYNYYKNKLAKDDTISDKVKDKFSKTRCTSNNTHNFYN